MDRSAAVQSLRAAWDDLARVTPLCDTCWRTATQPDVVSRRPVRSPVVAETPPLSPRYGNPNDPASYARGAPASRQPMPHRVRRRLWWVVAACGLVVVIVVAVAVPVVGHAGEERTSQAGANAALLPLSAMPAGTVLQGTAEIGGPKECPATSGQTPTVDVSRTFAPPGGPELYEEIEIDPTRGAAALVNDARKTIRVFNRAQTSDGTSYTVYELDAPRVTSNEVAFEITGSDLYAYVIAAPINHSCRARRGQSEQPRRAEHEGHRGVPRPSVASRASKARRLTARRLERDVSTQNSF